MEFSGPGRVRKSPKIHPAGGSIFGPPKNRVSGGPGNPYVDKGPFLGVRRAPSRGPSRTPRGGVPEGSGGPGRTRSGGPIFVNFRVLCYI